MPRNRNLPPYLEIRRARYYWRRRLPAFWLTGKKSQKIFLCLSLRTDLLRDAKCLTRRLTHLSDLAFAADAETAMAIAPETQANILESLARFEIEAFERMRALADPRSPEAAASDLRREEALQSALRQALYLGDREAARAPLRHVAAHLGLSLDEADPDWKILAYEATKELLDISRERVQRQRGIYAQPTIYFRRAVEQQPEPICQPVLVAPSAGEMAGFASAFTFPQPQNTSRAAMEPIRYAAPSQVAQVQAESPKPDLSADPAIPLPTVDETPPILPAGLSAPAGLDDATWQKIRIAARPPRIVVDQNLLTEQARNALAATRGITLPAALDLFFELRGLGYMDDFDGHQKRNPLEGKIWAKENESKARFAKAFWTETLGDGPVDEIAIHAVTDALTTLRSVPNNHGRSPADRGRYSYLELIEQADAEEEAGLNLVRSARAASKSDEEIDKIRLKASVKRISVATFIKHGRVLHAVGQMLWDMQRIDHNPFTICTWTNKEIRQLKKNEETTGRLAWDDRINDLFSSKIFQESLEDIGEPLFWAPLIARHQGLRMEECLRLGPDDFGADKGIPYMEVRNIEINGVKSSDGQRRLPVHPQLVKLGLLELVALRQKQEHIRLFPHINRGKQKERFSANFSKTFG